MNYSVRVVSENFNKSLKKMSKTEMTLITPIILDPNRSMTHDNSAEGPSLTEERARHEPVMVV